MKKSTFNKIAIVCLTALVASCSSNAHKSDPDGVFDYIHDQVATIPAPSGPFDQPQSFSTAKLLSPQVLSGINFRVEPRFINDGFLNTYTINTSYGKITAVSTARLYKRIHEMNVINQIEKMIRQKSL